jgi:hypothetical protein
MSCASRRLKHRSRRAYVCSVTRWRRINTSRRLLALLLSSHTLSSQSQNGTSTTTCSCFVRLFPTNSDDVRAMCPGSGSSVLLTPENFVKRDYMLLVQKSSMQRAHGSRASAPPPNTPTMKTHANKLRWKTVCVLLRRS